MATVAAAMARVVAAKVVEEMPLRCSSRLSCRVR
jgi:hypothetical protein